MNDGTLLQLKNISKSFPGVKALDNVSFSICPGEVHGLVGENGAGKSTIIKIIMGVYQRDGGEMLLDGEDYSPHNVIDSGKVGLSTVYQDLNLATHLSIGENFFMGDFPKKKTGLIDWDKVHGDARAILEDLHINVDTRLKITELSPAVQEMVAIAKAVHGKARLVVFDEPTALLSNEEVDILFSIIRKLKSEGVAILYISHRLEEIFRVCDTVTVFKDGRHVKTLPAKETNQEDLIALMVGRALTNMYDIEHHVSDKEVLKVANFSRAKAFDDISFSVNAGEIFGMFGLVGSGRTEVVRAIFGADPKDKGDVFLNGKQLQIEKPLDAISAGIGLVPEDRKQQGLAMSLSVKKNINLASYKSISRFSFINSKKEQQRALLYQNRLRIKTPHVDQIVKNLSGGNQQKVVISKWLCGKSQVFIFDEPTVGVDVGAKQEIYQLIESLTKDGHAIIIISSYLPEVMGLSDRIGVFHEGKMGRIVPREDFEEEKLLRYASGLK
ncbi:sugar ABC transporter ATP-binding protein [Parasphaerochaeta coccoides]|uniref:Monosaccharide-transporting ATPase n=1 Tax=Parasphaerochaeta coccoides (strain ATCC BAA-1237 / DSM 17374 / SPN1) TaxID=760011 RepID=F4GI98_PARC1|nr:sugar ABC transporter ATP-binding protein [Parasphaerochaeta coccoides]AEC01257.1 Monosaccharide-transporting ATPase [Parasphaerochaeta coccoides DSM 17374]